MRTHQTGDRTSIDYHPQQPVSPLDTNRPWYAGTDSRDERSGLEMERERRASAPASVLANDPVKSALVYGVVGQGQKQQPASDANYGNEGRSVPKPITNESQRTVSVPGASIVQAATQPIDNMRHPDLTTKDVLPGGYLDRGAGIVAQRGGNGRLNVTNVGTEGLTDPAKKIVDGSESALIDQKNSTYNPAAQLQRMQALRMTSDATDSTITDPAVRENAIKGLSLIQAAQAGEQGRQMAQLDTKIKQNGLARSAQEQQLIEQMNDRDITPEQRQVLRQNLLAMQGKNPNEHRYITLPNTKQYNAMGQISGEEQGGLFDSLTGQMVGQKQAQVSVPPIDKREVGKTYTTPKGPMIWRGNGWEAA